MPEGPSIVILKEKASIFSGEKVLSVHGNAKQDLQRLKGKKITDLKSWGKHFLICFDGFYVKVHLLLFGSYRINEQRNMSPRLALEFKNGELNFYNGSVKIIDGKPEDTYDWEVDTMSDQWNAERAVNALKKMKNTLVCDALLNQEVFAGSGNIIKNEVLFMVRTHPETLVESLSLRDKKKLVDVLRNYCFDFYRWKKAFELRKHWLIYRAHICPRCHTPVVMKVMGKTKRRTFFCPSCQVLKTP